MKTILIVDDVILNIDLLIGILNKEFKLLAAVNGIDALELLKRKKTDLVLLDVYMPEMDGFSVLRFMKEHAELCDIPVIFVTGEYDAHIEEECLALGAVDYIRKPYDATIIYEKVRKHLNI